MNEEKIVSRNISVKGQAIRAWRKEKGMSRSDVVKLSTEDGGTTISKATLERMEAEPKRKFNPEHVATVARVLDCPQSYLTETAKNLTPVLCTKVGEGRQLYDFAKVSAGLEVNVQVEPAGPAVHKAVLRIVENAEKALDNKMLHKTVDILRAQFEMREDIDILAGVKLWTYAGQFYRFDGQDFCRTLMILLTDEDANLVSVEGDTNIRNVEDLDRGAQVNAMLVAEGRTPLSGWQLEAAVEHEIGQRFDRYHYRLLEEKDWELEFWDTKIEAMATDEKKKYPAEVHAYEERKQTHKARLKARTDAEKTRIADLLRTATERRDTMSKAEKKEAAARQQAVEKRKQAYMTKLETEFSGEGS
jgi:transcriptional regulator with XRE-family HTH domain